MEKFLKTHNPDDIVSGIYRLATGKSADDDIQLAKNATTITIGSLPEKSEYMRYQNISKQRIAAYEANPAAVIAAHAKEYYLNTNDARNEVEKSIVNQRATLGKMAPILERSDIVSIEFTAFGYKEIVDYINTKVPGGVLDMASYKNGIPLLRCGQAFPQQLILTREAFEQVMQPLMQSKDIPLGEVKSFEVRDTTPNNGKPTVAYGASLGAAREAAGGCG